MDTRKLFLLVFAAVLASVAAPLIFHPAGHGPAAPGPGMPWDVQSLPGGGSKVFGLSLGASTVDEAAARLGDEAQLALIVGPAEEKSLEAYLDSVSLGPITGKMILTAELPAATLARMQERAVKREPQQSGTVRLTLAAEDRQAAGRASIRAITFIPAAKLEEQTVLQRFGRPAERVKGEGAEHFLYPEKGLDLVLSAKGKDLLQYVAPGEFGRLRQPLMAKVKSP